MILYVTCTSKFPADMRLKFISVIILQSLILIMFTAHTSSKKHVGTTDYESVILCRVPLSPTPFFLTLIISAQLLPHRQWHISMSICVSYSIKSFVRDSWSLESCPHWLDISEGWQIMWIFSLTPNLCLLSCFFPPKTS